MARISVLQCLRALTALGLVACGVSDDDHDVPDERAVAPGAAQRVDAAPRTDDALRSVDHAPRSTYDAPRSTAAQAKAACTIAPDCSPVRAIVFNLDPCCTQTTSCGFRFWSVIPGFPDTVPEALGVPPGETCVPRERYFIRHPTLDDMRVPTENGKDILLSSGCDTASMLSLPFSGCCMPNNRCGVSTYAVWDTIAVLAPRVPFAKLQCTSAKELNAQVAASQFRGLNFLPDTDAPCDYAALDAKLPPVE